MMQSNPILEYSEKIQSGEIVTSKKIKSIYKYLASAITDDKSDCFYDSHRADFAINFIEVFCRHSKSEWAGQNVKLELWQRALVAAIFGVINKKTGLRRFKEIFLVVGKKNGKSLLVSAIALYMLIADGEAGAEIYCVATKREQARIIWQEAKFMVEQSPSLSKRVKILISSLIYKKNNSVIKTLSGDSKTEDGLNIACACCDEVHAWGGVDLYNVVADGVSARREPLILITSTAGVVREGIYDLKYEMSERVINGLFDKNGYKEPHFLPIIYEIDSRSEWLERDCWIKANPNLGVSKKIEYLEDKVNQAKEFSRTLKNLLTKEFNIRETSDEVWLDFDDIDNLSTFDIDVLKPEYGIGGTDLSKNTDLTCACVLFAVPGNDTLYVKSMYWLPEDLLDKRTKEDKIPYDLWYNQGFLRLSKGNKVDYDDVVDWFNELQNEHGCYIYDHGYDGWSATAFVKKMNDNFGDIGHAVIQGKKTLSNPMSQLGAELASKKINYGNNPVTKWCLTNVRADIDKNGNMQPAKTSNQRRRIDGFAAMLNAYVRFTEIKDEYLNEING